MNWDTSSSVGAPEQPPPLPYADPSTSGVSLPTSPNVPDRLSTSSLPSQLNGYQAPHTHSMAPGGPRPYVYARTLPSPPIVNPQPEIPPLPLPLHAEHTSPSEAPPGYDVARTPLMPIRYQFSNVGPNRMVLLPPAEAPDTRPVYHISVSSNCFVPYSFITTITRGGSPGGELVAEYELGSLVKPNVRPPTINFGRQEYKMRELFGRTKGTANRWTWYSPREDRPFGKQRFEWDFSGMTQDQKVTCKLWYTPYTLLATYTPPELPRPHDQFTQLHTLEVTPDGHEYFDEILLSVLIAESERHLREARK
ncbi:hypothetical protein NP233_g6300 [Leucocoprinus birnbaumii]|uniref:DUF6593 domain-containing protein n=1 Tax=Leucocoprinus birnbaumii TaxID=56174 RepID=A0AAD5VTJ5_9AGAR|nr:hypothetical protein NP233_g6300 [Leucocoprinus birnbaumii]